jgi:hypothetical protein
MKKSIAMMVMVTGMTVATTAAMGADASYIPWTFDDFDNNCEVIETAEGQPLELSAVSVEINDEIEAGELGW